VRLREAGDAEGARVALLGLVAERPGDAVVNYQTACAHDVLGLEAQAVPFSSHGAVRLRPRAQTAPD
jgi:hypothetical protein